MPQLSVQHILLSFNNYADLTTAECWGSVLWVSACSAQEKVVRVIVIVPVIRQICRRVSVGAVHGKIIFARTANPVDDQAVFALVNL